ncbi:GNAT family N-acetyltransferase [Nonomuraea pusilla]|uniref:GNAT family N-acetyltransferase n=1 Tax=Nonomuraea pusilla TaxID=46177 RepID=UPI00331E77BD
MAWRDLMEDGSGRGGVRLEESPYESARFGHAVERLTVPAGAPGISQAGVREAVLGSRADVIVLRYPAERVSWFAELAVLGRTAVFADSLVYWRLRAGEGRPPEPRDGLRCHDLADGAAVGELVAAVFAEYGNHYAANPLFDPGQALAGYREWAARSAAAGGCLALYEGEAGDALALATLEDDPVRTEILLAGVMPGRQGRGLYAHLLGGIEERALARGAKEVVISTQGHNNGVQRAWARYGFEPVRTFVTVHLVRTPLLQGRTG